MKHSTDAREEQRSYRCSSQLEAAGSNMKTSKALAKRKGREDVRDNLEVRDATRLTPARWSGPSTR